MNKHPTLPIDPRLQEILAAHRAASAAGEAPEDLAARHPDLADEIRTALGVPGTPGTDAGAPTLRFSVQAAAPECSPCSPTWTHPDPGAAAGPPGPRAFGDFVLLEEVARGGMGVVYRAHQISLNRIVALKMILDGQLASAEQVRRFHLEAEEASHLEHPHIVPIYQVGAEHGQHYYAMKFIEGGSLSRHLARFPDDPRGAAALVAAIARAVHYAHQRGILHRDLKPGNILVDADGQPHVTDFGLAKHLGGAPGDTSSGAIVGTPGFIAPEQAAASRTLTTACDVYGLGAVLYNLLTGRPPFKADTTLDTLLEVLEHEPIRPRNLNRHVPRDLETVCLKCLHKEPRRRYASAEALVRDLERFLAGEPVRARRAGPVERAFKWARRRPAAAGLLTVCVLGTISLAAFISLHNVRLEAALREAHSAQATALAIASVAQVEREQADQQRLRADEQRRIAEDQRRVAVAGYEKRRELVDDTLIRMDDRLDKEEDIRPSLRLEFLKDALRISQDVLADDPADPVARRQVARINRCIGDLYGRQDPDEAEKAYRVALEQLGSLTAALPDRPAYLGDEALTRGHYGRLKQGQKQYSEAIAELRRAVELQDRLVSLTARATDRGRAGRIRAALAEALAEAGKPQEAEAAYREAIICHKKLAGAQTRDPSHLTDLANASAGLSALLEAPRPAEAEQLLEQSLDARRRACRAAPGRSSFLLALHQAYADAAASLKERHCHTELARLARSYRRDFAAVDGETYNAACFMANAAEAARNDARLSQAERHRLADAYGTEAVAVLDKAVKQGWDDSLHLSTDPDLDLLRDRPDFRRIQTDLDKRSPVRDPGVQCAKLIGRYAKERRVYEAASGQALTTADRRQLRAFKPDFVQYARTFLAMAERFRDSPAAVEALTWILSHADEADKPSEGMPFREKALALLKRDHLGEADLPTVCRKFAEDPVPEADEVLRAALAKHQDRDVKGLAAYALAVSLARKAEQARKDNDPAAESWTREAEQQLEQVRAYGSVSYGSTTLGEVAEAKLHELRHLTVGRPAQEITGEELDGRPLKLSGYRGKVVLLDFWCDWCGWCRQMYPQERSLIKRLEGRPFALLGVNCDDDKEEATKAVKRNHLNWPSWWDGGRAGGGIHEPWQVHAFPCVYVLDHKGVIRYRSHGAQNRDLDATIERLVKEAERDLHARKQ